MFKLPFTFRQLEVFTALSETQSFRECAEVLGISQASVSSQIKCLEDQMGTRLFLRRPGKRPSLTSAGLAFLEDLRGFADAGARLARHRRQTSQLEKMASYRVLVGQSLMDHLIKPKLSEFFSTHPTVDCRFETRPTYDQEKAIEQIGSGSYDFALIHLREGLSLIPGMRKVASVNGGIFGHRKFAEGRSLPLTAEQVNDLPFILATLNSQKDRQVLAALARSGIRPRNIIGHAQYFEVIAAMVEQGLGVASLLHALFRPEKVSEIVMLYPTEGWQLVSYNKHHHGDPRVDDLENFMIRAVLDNPLYQWS